MNIAAYPALLVTLLLSGPLAAQSIPFDICAESTTWTRPAPEVQAKVWNDPRWKDIARDAYAWTHNFIFIDDPMSASVTGMYRDLSGMWTAEPDQTNPNCNTPRSGYEWITFWSLLHRVKEVRRDANTYTVVVEPVAKGFQFVFISRMNPKAVLRFVTPDGAVLEVWDESAPPKQFTQTIPPGARIIAPNGQIRK